MGTEAGGLPFPLTKEGWEESLNGLRPHATMILYVATMESDGSHAMPEGAITSLVSFLHTKGYGHCFDADGRLLLDNEGVVYDCRWVMDLTISFDLLMERGFTNLRHAASVLNEFREMFEDTSLGISFKGLYASLPMFSGAAHVLFNVLESLRLRRGLIPRHEPFSLFVDPSLYKTVAKVDMAMLLEHVIQRHKESRGELPQSIVLPFRLIDSPKDLDCGNCIYSFSIAREPSAKRARTDTTTLKVTTRSK